MIDPSTQIKKSDSYNDSLTVDGTLESNAVTIEDDLNAIRSAIKKLTGETNWYAAPPVDLKTTASAVAVYQYDRKDAPYYGAERIDDNRWIIKKQEVSGSTVVLTFANEANNVTYTTLNDAWTNRLTLTYDTWGNMTDV